MDVISDQSRTDGPFAVSVSIVGVHGIRQGFTELLSISHPRYCSACQHPCPRHLHFAPLQLVARDILRLLLVYQNSKANVWFRAQQEDT